MDYPYLFAFFDKYSILIFIYMFHVKHLYFIYHIIYCLFIPIMSIKISLVSS